MSTSGAKSVQVSSAVGDDDLAILKEIGSGDSRSATAPETVTSPPRVDPSKLRIVAYLGWFDPLRLWPGASEHDMRALLDLCTVSTDGNASTWMVRADERLRVLGEIAVEPAGLARGALEADRFRLADDTRPDALAEAVVRLTSGKVPGRAQIASMSKESLAAYQAALGWLERAPFKVPVDAVALHTEIQFMEILEPFRFLTGYDPRTRSDTFVGRKDELEDLRAFVDVLDSESLVEGAVRGAVRGVRALQTGSPVLLISGIGGVGKSTLIGKFILQHVDESNARRLRFAYVDFDRATVSAAQPATMLLEMARQIGWQMPHARRFFESFRQRIRAQMQQKKREGTERPRETGGREGWETPALPPELIDSTDMHRYLVELNGQLQAAETGREPLLLVLDTFEEAQVIGDDAVARVQGFIEQVRMLINDARIVVVGRDEASGYFDYASRKSLEAFKDMASRKAFLEKRGVPPELSDLTARLAGGRPLALLLAARMVEEQGRDSLKLTLTQTVRAIFQRRPIDGILYERIIGHIDDKRLQELAHPGFVLRRLDPRVIREVVVPTLSLDEFTPSEIERVMGKLRLQKDLVRVEPDGSVRHRPDVRGQMLELIRADKPEESRRLHRAAAAYYARLQEEPGVADEQKERYRLEEIYHRLCVGDVARITELWMPEARIDLARAVDEIGDPGGRGALKILIGRMPTVEEAKKLPASMAGEYALRSIRLALAAEEPEKAFRTLEESGRKIPGRTREALERDVYDRAGRWDRASAAYERTVSGGSIEEMLAAADFFERTGDRKPMRDTAGGLISAREADRPASPLPLALTLHRLNVRLGRVKGKRRPSATQLIGDTKDAGAHLWPVKDAPDNDMKWLVTLTNDVDERGLHLFDGIPVTDTVRGQLEFLAALLVSSRRPSERDERALVVCRTLIGGDLIGMRRPVRGDSTQDREAIAFVLLHLLRPATPRWYVPLACLTREAFGQTIRLGSLVDESRVRLPFSASATFRSTKALSDFFAQLDQLGILYAALARLEEAEDSSAASARYAELMRLYAAWRSAFFADADEWMAAALDDLPENPDDSWYGALGRAVKSRLKRRT